MDKLKLIFSYNGTPGEMLIRIGTWSQWGHAGVVYENMGEVRVIESRPFKGVRDITLSEFLKHTKKHEFKEVEVEDAAKGIAWAKTQIGKSYDWGGVVSFASHRDWAEDDRWFCSELCEATVLAAGRARFVDGSIKRVSPQMAWMVV